MIHVNRVVGVFLVSFALTFLIFRALYEERIRLGVGRASGAIFSWVSVLLAASTVLWVRLAYFTRLGATSTCRRAGGSEFYSRNRNFSSVQA
jgi:hypothetical protein